MKVTATVGFAALLMDAAEAARADGKVDRVGVVISFDGSIAVQMSIGAESISRGISAYDLRMLSPEHARGIVDHIIREFPEVA